MDIGEIIRGCFYGALMGDVFGAPFELISVVELRNVLTFLNKFMETGSENELHHTDDTVMAFGICASLKRHNGFNCKDLAQTFAVDFFKAPSKRLYGNNIKLLFTTMQENGYANAMEVAAKQFNGTGSFGNGGGMRVYPAAIFACRLPIPEFNRLISRVTAVTHAHPLGIYGALLQAHAIRRLFNMSLKSTKPSIDISKFVDAIYKDVVEADIVEFTAVKQKSRDCITSAQTLLFSKLQHVKRMAMTEAIASVSEVVKFLGNGEAAMESIPTALYVFLRCLGPIPSIEYESLPVKCTAYANSIGYDTDTIGSMACALAGTYVGAPRRLVDADPLSDSGQFPASIMQACEGLSVSNNYVDWLTEVLKQTELDCANYN